ncbi:hypothetical protein [Polyangium sp. 6x1]|uniref:hypothetical protein n=1 Tax=Polyangium sp. 6x1 TaxID=3042689 RepID=UPI002483264E|nr:hypothetical protein [Polyangium sp. 6x1]MDI1448635.1 hypothetical protein [Polyangium sp. 6x1]
MSFLRFLAVVGLSAFFVGCGDEVVETDSGATLWARRFGRGNDVEPVGLAGVESGGVIVAGRLYGDADLGGGTLPGPGNNYQAYVARYDGEGRHVYSRSFGDVFAEGANDVAALPDGSALVAGTYGFQIELDDVSLLSDGRDDAFAVKLDPAGKVVWARSFGGAGHQRAVAIAALPDGGAIVAGMSSDELRLGTGEPEDTGFGLPFLVRLGADGALLWSRVLHSEPGFTFVHDVAAQGDVIAVVGTFSHSLDLGFGTEIVTAMSVDGFVAVYDLEGKPLRGRPIGDPSSYDHVTAVAFTGDGGLVFTGDAQGNVDLGGGILSSSTDVDMNTYLLELDAPLNHRRSALYGGDKPDTGNGLATASDGSVILTGAMHGHMSFGTATLAASEEGDAFVAKLDADRNPVFLRRIGGTDAQSGLRAVVDGEGRVYIAGMARGVVDFGLGPTEASGYYETFVVGFAP